MDPQQPSDDVNMEIRWWPLAVWVQMNGAQANGIERTLSMGRTYRLRLQPTHHHRKRQRAQMPNPPMYLSFSVQQTTSSLPYTNARRHPINIRYLRTCLQGLHKLCSACSIIRLLPALQKELWPMFFSPGPHHLIVSKNAGSTGVKITLGLTRHSFVPAVQR